MNDTHPEIEKIYGALMSRLSSEEKAKMGCSMHDSSKEIALSQLSLPNQSKSQIMSELLLRFYRDDFSEAVLEKILRRLREYHSKN